MTGRIEGDAETVRPLDEIFDDLFGQISSFSLSKPVEFKRKFIEEATKNNDYTKEEATELYSNNRDKVNAHFKNINLRSGLPTALEDEAKSAEDLDKEKQKISDFRENHLNDIYEEILEKRKDGKRIRLSEIIGWLEKSNDSKYVDLAELISKNHRAHAHKEWEAFMMLKILDHNKKEEQVAHKFIQKSLKPQDFDNLEAAALKFHKEHPEFAGKEKIEWFVKEAKALEKDLAKDWKTEITNFYKSDTFKEAYKAASVRLGHEPNGKDILAELQKDAKNEDIVFLMKKFEAHSLAEWSKVWGKVSESNRGFENKALVDFTKDLKPKDWDNLDALAKRFQATHPKRFAGKDRLYWYRDTYFAQEKEKLNTQWTIDVNNFYQNQLPGIYAQASQNLNKAPEWQDIKELITDPNLLHLLENNFKTESETKWTAFWKAEKEKFNEVGNEKLDKFLYRLKPAQLDSYETAKTDFEAANPGLKADDKWFKPAYEKKYKEALNSYNNNHEKLVNTLPDSALAAAMHRAFKGAENFTDRSKWLAENRQKVSEYAPLIESNNQKENELSARTAEHPDLKKSLAEIKSEYNEGRKNYTENFYSPRKYAAALQEFNIRLNERERLVSDTITRAENRTFNQIPKLTDKKKLDYDEFRDALKKLDFYTLDPAVRKNEKVRTAIRTKTKELHQQWLDHRDLHIEQNQRTKVEKSQAVIRRIKLPKNLPDGIKDYEAFTVSLKEKGVYAALPKGVLKNDKVRATAHDQNLKMWTAYQAAQAKTEAKTDTPENAEIASNPKLEQAQNLIKGVTLNTNLKTKLDEKLKDKDAKNPDTFTAALRQIGIYQQVDKSLWNTPALREMAWQQNMKLQKEYLSPDVHKTTAEADKQAEGNAEHGLPGHYKIDWKGLDNRLPPDQKARGIERFKQMHNRSDIGLQTLMSQFHGPLGTFILETLAIMPRDRYDKAVNALRDVRIESGKRDQASLWMKTLCQAAGTDYLQKEASASWSNFRQNFSTHFGTSIDKAWEEPELTEEAVEVTETSEELADNTSERASSILDKPTEDDQTPPADDKAIPDDEDENLIPEEPLDATEVLDVDTEKDEALIEDDLDDEDLTEAETQEPETIEPAEIESPDLETTDTNTNIVDEEPEALTGDVENDDDEAEVSPETEDESILEDTEELVDDEENMESIIDDNEDVAEVTDEEADTTPEEADEKTDQSPTLETVEDEEEIAETVEDSTEKTPETIIVTIVEAEDQQAKTQAATQAWKAHQSTQIQSVAQRLTPHWLKGKEGELPTEQEITQLLKDPALREQVLAWLKNQPKTNKEPHFTTTLYQEVHMASSMTVIKFLEQLKTYALLSAELEVTIGHHNPTDEITKQQAQALFEAFAEKLHSTGNIDSMIVSFTNHTLQAKVTAKNQTQTWQFKID